MQLEDPTIELLILDFAGVCTPAPNELLDVAPAAPVPIRPGIVDLVSAVSSRGVTVVVLSNEISLWRLVRRSPKTCCLESPLMI